MWSKLRETVAGFAEQAGIEIPGLDAGAAVVDAAEGLIGSAEPPDVAGGTSP